MSEGVHGSGRPVGQTCPVLLAVAGPDRQDGAICFPLAPSTQHLTPAFSVYTRSYPGLQNANPDENPGSGLSTTAVRHAKSLTFGKDLVSFPRWESLLTIDVAAIAHL